MKEPKIVFIGAGSMSFGINTFRDIFSCPGLRKATLCLVDIDPENLERMYTLAQKLNAVSGMELIIEKSKERRSVFPGADFVINSLAIERCELWKKDFEIPKKYGIRHCLAENGGPGALFFTMRTIPVIMDIIHDMEALCPDAWFLNFSNPESRIVLAVNMYSKIKCIGLCHGIFSVAGRIAPIFNRLPGSFELYAAGMNHFQWILAMRDRQTGEDLYPIFRKMEKNYDPSYMPYSRKMFHFFGFFPTCSDDHLGEYQAYGYEAGEHGYDFDADEQERIRRKREIAEVVAGSRDPSPWLKPSEEQAINVLTSIHFNKRTNIPSAIIRNGGAIPQLPADVAVEVPVTVDGNGVHPWMISDLPDGPIGALHMQVSAQRLSVKAAMLGSKELALQALLCDPVINSTDSAVKIVDDLFEINKPYIRKCI